MNAVEFIRLIFELHQADRAEERRAFYAVFEPFPTTFTWPPHNQT